MTLHVEADLRISTDGLQFRLLGQGDRLVVLLDSLGAARTLWRHRPDGDLERRTVQNVDAVLRWARIGLDIALRGFVVARLGWGALPSRLGRAAGIPELELRFFPLLLAVVKAVAGPSDRS
ncbi:MAG: hypothetical protein HY712_04720 [candidate division NC10 bacterium]|nr:hypothetical protein [candidate division NC10 bacterium]